MKKLLCTLTALTCIVSVTACGSSSSSSESVTTQATTQAEATTPTEIDITLSSVYGWVVGEMWNDGLCDISWYVENGTNSVGGELDIDFLLDNLKYSYEKKPKYDEYMKSLDTSIGNQAQLVNAWNKLSEQIDILYSKVSAEKPRPKDDTYDFNTDLFKQYFDKFVELEADVEAPTLATTTSISLETTMPTTEEVTEDMKASAPETSAEFVEIIGKDLEITKITTMAAEMIGAEEGTSFRYNDNKFEIYRFKSGDPKIEQAKSGSLTYTVEGFGDMTSKSSVNGDFVMIYGTPEDKVIEAFERIS